MKFAITTKSGRSVIVQADNYKQAEKEAERRFGKGCVVDMVGNTQRGINTMIKSINTVVQNAIAVNAKVALNNRMDMPKIKASLPSGCTMIGRPKYYGSSYRGESIMFDVKFAEGQEDRCSKALESKGFYVDSNGNGTAEVEIPERKVWDYMMF